MYRGRPVKTQRNLAVAPDDMSMPLNPNFYGSRVGGSPSCLMSLARRGFSRELPRGMRILMRLHETKSHEISLMRSCYY
jgi:hypothetical protein